VEQNYVAHDRPVNGLASEDRGADSKCLPVGFLQKQQHDFRAWGTTRLYRCLSARKIEKPIAIVPFLQRGIANDFFTF
jgi:hypothetical protein